MNLDIPDGLACNESVIRLEEKLRSNAEEGIKQSLLNSMCLGAWFMAIPKLETMQDKGDKKFKFMWRFLKLSRNHKSLLLSTENQDQVNPQENQIIPVEDVVDVRISSFPAPIMQQLGLSKIEKIALIGKDNVLVELGCSSARTLADFSDGLRLLTGGTFCAPENLNCINQLVSTSLFVRLMDIPHEKILQK